MLRLLTHNDLDGVGCGILAKAAFGKEVDVSYNSIDSINHQTAIFLDKNNTNVELLITDLSVNEENEKKIEEFVHSGGNAILIDHHKSAEHFNRHPWARVDITHADGSPASATSLLYGYLQENGYLEPAPAMDQFVELVRQYDTWEWDKLNNIQAKRLNDLFFMFSIEDFEEKMLRKLAEANEFAFDELETKLLEIEEERVERYIRRKKREVYQAQINGYFVGIVHAESYHSELGNELSKEFPYLDYISIVMVGRKRMSLRTIHDNVDVSAIAADYDGGGHQKAAGCNLTLEAYLQFVEQTFHSEPIQQDAHRNRYNLKDNPSGSLFMNSNDDFFFIFKEKDYWNLHINHSHHPEQFDSFAEAEKFVKRNYASSLVRDDRFVKYLLKSHLDSELIKETPEGY
ncbi:oligoribonuclease [Bacillus sp. M6-12]|uniref:DHH family phosphoesterase n=1 Tax=Bacillus sp. M6-12 TaxID=2054166 RepID=UPI000C77EC5D|nr:oligoribonuclease [Bacillus sp. M6-12]PLS18020.1 oligoribonuclease [Bacillus sp. M6-12]